MVISILPFVLVGTIMGLFVSQTAIGLMPFLGMIALTGVVVNDSLVMVDIINKMRLRGMPKVEAVIEGAKSRFRPTITTIVGIAPLAFGILGEEPFLAPMAITLLCGMVFSMFFLVMLFPVIYLLIDNTANWIHNKIFKRSYQIEKKPSSEIG